MSTDEYTVHGHWRIDGEGALHWIPTYIKTRGTITKRFVVGRVGEDGVFLDQFDTEEEAARFIDTFPVEEVQAGAFYIDDMEDPDAEEDEKSYKIVRFCQDENDPRHRDVIATGLTLEEAQAHCQREDTHGVGWFDGYTEES